MDYCCRDCQKYFSVRTGTQMEKSRLSLKIWAMSIYLYLNNPRVLTSVLLSKAMCQLSLEKFDGTVEVDETYYGW